MIGYTSERIDNWVLLKSNCGEPVFSNDPMEALPLDDVPRT